MNAVDRLRFRSGSVYAPVGAAPDTGMAMGPGFNANVSVGAGLDGSVQVAGVMVLLLLGVLIASHVIAR